MHFISASHTSISSCHVLGTLKGLISLFLRGFFSVCRLHKHFFLPLLYLFVILLNYSTDVIMEFRRVMFPSWQLRDVLIYSDEENRVVCPRSSIYFQYLLYRLRLTSVSLWQFSIKLIFIQVRSGFSLCSVYSLISMWWYFFSLVTLGREAD